MQALLAAGADAKAADKYAKTALHFASETGSLEIVQAPLAALRLASEKGSLRIAQAPLAAGAEAKQRISM